MSQAPSFTRVDWNTYGRMVDTLWDKLHDYLTASGTTIDAVVPILREGGFTALPLAYKLNTWKVIPAHYKYRLFEGGYALEKKAELPNLLYELPAKPTFLLVDTYPVKGDTSVAAAGDLKAAYPDCRIVCALLFCDPAQFAMDNPLFQAVVYGTRADVLGTYSPEEAARLGYDQTQYLFPWQHEKEESAGFTGEAYTYS